MPFDYEVATGDLFMRGHLGIWNREVDLDPIGDPMDVRCLRIFGRLLDEPAGRALLSQIEQDSRVQSLKDKMISNGTGAGIFDPSKLARWYLWLMNRSGKLIADNAMETFLDSDEITVIPVVGFDGFVASKKISLTPQMILIPVNHLIDCNLKELLLRKRFAMGAGEMRSEIGGVIAGNCRIPKASTSLDELGNGTEHLRKFFQDAYDALLVLNSLSQVNATPTFSTCIAPDETPFGPFSGGSWSHFIQGRTVFGMSASQDLDLESFQNAWEKFDKLSDTRSVKKASKKDLWRRILTRLAYAKGSCDAADSVLELCIALEMMLQEDNSNKEQLSLTFRLRGAWLLEPQQGNPQDAERRLEVHNILKFVYECRSEVAHRGSLTGEKRREFERRRLEIFNIAERIARALLANPSSDPSWWTKLILSC